MPGRRLVILVLMIAVLSMHGAQYMSAGAHGPAAVTAEHPIDAAAATALILAPLSLVDDVGMTMAAEQLAAPSLVAAGTMPAHSLPAHVWSLCLAVLLAGFALLGAALARRTTAGRVHASLSPSRVPVLRFSPPRPPDLAVLCLLRI